MRSCLLLFSHARFPLLLARAPALPPPTWRYLHRLQSKKGGSVQFVALDDSFVITRIGVNAEGKEQLSSWTAVRRGGPRKRVGDARADGKKSLLSRYGWYLGLAMLYVGYKGVTTKAVNMAMAAHSKKKK